MNPIEFYSRLKQLWIDGWLFIIWHENKMKTRICHKIKMILKPDLWFFESTWFGHVSNFSMNFNNFLKLQTRSYYILLYFEEFEINRKNNLWILNSKYRYCHSNQLYAFQNLLENWVYYFASQIYNFLIRNEIIQIMEFTLKRGEELKTSFCSLGTNGNQWLSFIQERYQIPKLSIKIPKTRSIPIAG